MNAERTAAVDEARTLTYLDLGQRSARLANILLGLGEKDTRPVASLMRNRTEYVEADVACARAGLPRVGISERLSPDEVQFILEHSGSSVLITEPAHLERIDTLPDGVRTVLLLDAAGQTALGGGTRIRGYEDEINTGSTVLRVPRISPESCTYILYTSGTSGRPKGAAHSQAARVAATVNMLASELSLNTDSVMLHAGPVTHGSGSKILPFLATGGANVLLARFDMDDLADYCASHRATHTFLVPTMIQRLLDGNPRVRAAVRSLKQVSFGGSPIDSAVFERAIDEFGPIFTQVYGSCEAPHPITLLRPNDYLDANLSERVLRSAGLPSPGSDVRVADDESETVGAESVGELHVSASHLMTGYWQDKEATESTFDDGWYRTGDLVRMDPDGLVTFEDRKKDLIITGGLNVYPSEVERVLADHPAVRHVAVVGYPDKEWGESVAAFVVPVGRPIVSEQELIDWVRTRLASYKKPRRIEFLEQLPIGSSNKVLKRALRERVAGDEFGT